MNLIWGDQRLSERITLLASFNNLSFSQESQIKLLAFPMNFLSWLSDEAEPKNPKRIKAQHHHQQQHHQAGQNKSFPGIKSCCCQLPAGCCGWCYKKDFFPSRNLAMWWFSAKLSLDVCILQKAFQRVWRRYFKEVRPDIMISECTIFFLLATYLSPTSNKDATPGDALQISTGKWGGDPGCG